MTKKEAIKSMVNGRKVTHPIWNKGEYIYMDQETMGLVDETGQRFNWNWFWKLKDQPKWQKNWSIILSMP